MFLFLTFVCCLIILRLAILYCVPIVEILVFIFNTGQNRVRFYAKEIDCNAHFSVFYWDLNAPVVVCDIDGTLTKSDVRGYMETVYFNRYSYVHEGAVTLIRSLESDFNCNIVYLTTRPIEHQRETKLFLEGLEQDGHSLPRGPLFTNKKFIGNVIYEEIFVKVIQFISSFT